MNPWLVFLIIVLTSFVLIPVFLYLTTRLVTSAYFKSKSESIRKRWEKIKND